MKVVLTNDDGIDAPGLGALRKAVTAESTVVAPASAMSQCSHRITTHEPIHVHRRPNGDYAVAAAPADCVRVALHHCLPDAEWVVSGINAGGNLGADVYVSGTVAAAREAAFLGVPAVAVSHYKRRDLDFDWDQAAQWTAMVLADILQTKAERGVYWNVNLPHLPPEAAEPEVVHCSICTEPLPVDFEIDGDYFHYRGVYANRNRTPNSDVDHCLAGRITISRLRLGQG